MCRFSELTGCKLRREVTLDETYDCQLLLSKITRTGIEFELLTAMHLAVFRSTVPLVVDFAIVVVVTVTCSFGIPLGMLFLFGLLCSSEGLSILRKSIGDAFHHSVGISLFLPYFVGKFRHYDRN